MSTASRTPDQINSDIAATRDRLASTIDTLAYRSSPKTIASRQFESLKAKFVNPDGSVNTAMVGKVAAGVVGFVVVVVTIRKVVG